MERKMCSYLEWELTVSGHRRTHKDIHDGRDVPARKYDMSMTTIKYVSLQIRAQTNDNTIAGVGGVAQDMHKRRVALDLQPPCERLPLAQSNARTSARWQ
jgi:hypothetical protein